jgi:hypothetical protein
VAAFICAVRLPTELAAINCLHLWIPSAFSRRLNTHSLLSDFNFHTPLPSRGVTYVCRGCRNNLTVMIK